MHYQNGYYDSNIERHKYILEYDEFLKDEWGPLKGVQNLSETVHVFVRSSEAIKRIKDHWRWREIKRSEITYRKRYFGVRFLDCDYLRTYVYFAYRVIKSVKKWVALMCLAPNDTANLLILGEKYGVVIAPRCRNYRWYECPLCGAIIEYRDKVSEEKCARCYGEGWRFLENDKYNIGHME